MELTLKKDGMEAQYQESRIRMGADEVRQECSGCSVSVSGLGIVIEGDLTVHGVITEGG